MQCKKCKKECIESELINGFCYDCLEKYDNDTCKLKEIENPIAKYFKIWCIVAIIIGILLGVANFCIENDFIISLIYIICSFVVGAFLRAISEIIQLLEDIKNK